MTRSYQDALDIARGCRSYNGGHGGEALRAYHHGIETVIAALEAEPNDTQVQALRIFGREEADRARIK